MKRSILISIILGFCSLLIYSCLDPFNPRTSTADLNYLVVEGILNSNGITSVKLTRTSPISVEEVSSVEAFASVEIEGKNGITYVLQEHEPGTYEASTSGLDVNSQYRLKIKTIDQKEYASDYVPVKDAPDIDSLSYSVRGQDLSLNVSTHDDSNNTKYYLWKYVETWAYTSRYTSDYIFSEGIMVMRPDRYELYNCWMTVPSSQILLGSTVKLDDDVVSEFPIIKMDIHTEKIQSKYSVLVEQFALTHDAFEYWQQLKKSTESVGSIFDPQPSQTSTNIHGVTSPNEPVVGYFSAGVSKTRRIFITKDDIPDVDHHTGYEECKVDTLYVASVPNFGGGLLVVAAVSDMRGAIIYYTIATKTCVDCQLHGGTTVKPDFWD